ncbi:MULTISPECIES: Flp family type IVb pilin [Agrobacterium]|jgi:pilus assembly protein Flp/PilA|uniref:Flp family type IVb pilin n=1 Tax=Agrobacterium salinitolerans TaxID=1183413 RepID=A0A1S9E6C9_9HYPH|nr:MULTISPECIES: Flp family type IVb pilin [Agrobacterium]MBA4774719.1 Flp family type IVb pilin [Hyphomicrobiales bacterium]PNQ20659.1 Flp family type IVb pilin [Rhizobium sp. YIC5082]MCZ7852213.1 Flp family type IVb pilin [Agrobacterium salinitolerans]MCZ7857233.1 Flp family type IVb pilin [Agrobacterium salinitolerans]MCZ7862345.1 Flp family type IVb pilin [Agrobacterium salinitolerans]
MADGEYPVLHFLINLCKNENGATAVEYGLIVGVISAALIVGAGSISSNINDVFQFIADTLAE